MESDYSQLFASEPHALRMSTSRRRGLLLFLFEVTTLVILANPIFLLVPGLFLSPYFAGSTLLHLGAGIGLVVLTLCWMSLSTQRTGLSASDLGLTTGYLARFLVNSLFLIIPILGITWLLPMMVYTLMTAGDWVTLLFSFFFGVVFVPIYDEFVFRGYILQRFSQLLQDKVYHATGFASGISAVFYGLWRIPFGLPLLLGVPPFPCHLAFLASGLAIASGLIFNLIRIKTGSLLPGITVHGVSAFVYSLLPLLLPLFWSM